MRVCVARTHTLSHTYVDMCVHVRLTCAFIKQVKPVKQVKQVTQVKHLMHTPLQKDPHASVRMEAEEASMGGGGSRLGT